MTTTAEKIRDLQLGIKRTEEAIGVIKSLQIELTKIKQGIKPADPEPLECWITLNEKGRITSASKHMPHPVGNATMIPVREVTPQDEQDRKDAKRYRFLKETEQGRDLLMPGYRETWDEIIDHAMVDEMIDKAMEEV